MRETLSQFAGFGVPEEDRVANGESDPRRKAHGSLNFSRTFMVEQFHASGQEGPRQSIAARRAGGDVPTSQTRDDSIRGTARDLQRKAQRGSVPKTLKMIEQARCV